MKIRNILYAAFGAAILFASCDNVSESDRFVEVDPVKPVNPGDSGEASISRIVLVEEFSGQGCVNCPTGARKLEEIQEMYGGADTVIAVTIHGGPLAIKPRPGFVGLRTDYGDYLYNNAGVQSNPAAVVDRYSGVLSSDFWLTGVRNAFTRAVSVSLSLSTAYNPADSVATINVEASSLKSFSGKLQVWLIEDGIVAPQYDYDSNGNSTTVMDYVHNNVLRAAVNGQDGSAFTVSGDAPSAQTFTVKVKSGDSLVDWHPENMSVVAFVYDGGGVQQVAKCRVVAQEAE